MRVGQTPDAANRPPPDAAMMMPPSSPVVIRAKQIQADTVRADVVFAKEIFAAEARIDRLFESSEEKRWESERGEGQITVLNLVAGQIFVKEIRCRRLEAREVHAQKVTVAGR